MIVSIRWTSLTLISCALLSLPGPARALAILHSLPTGSQPASVAVNPLTNRSYVANAGGNTVSVIDNATGTVAATINVDAGPCAVAVNPLTNTVYVANQGGNSVSVIDGGTHAATSVTVGQGPTALALNGTTGQVYVANTAGGTVSQLTGSAVTRTFTVGSGPGAIAVNAVTNRIYVGNGGGSSVTVINGATGAVSTVATGAGPVAVGVNPVTNLIYIANAGGNSITVLNGATGTVAQTVTGDTVPAALAVNPVTNKVYVANRGSRKLTVIDGSTHAKTYTYGLIRPSAMALNPATGMIYVANDSADRLCVYDASKMGTGSQLTTLSLKAGSGSTALAVNPITGQILVANRGIGEVDVLDGAGYVEHPGIQLPGYSQNPAFDPVAQKLYIPRHEVQGVITVVDAASGTVEASLPVPDPYPYAVGINPVTRKLYVCYSSTLKVHVIDMETRAMKEILLPSTSTSGSGREFTVNPVTNKIFLQGNSYLWLIDGAADSVAIVSDSDIPLVNPAVGKVYLRDSRYDAVDILEEASNRIAKRSLLFSDGELALDPVAHGIYVNNTSGSAINSGWVGILDGFTDKLDMIPGLSIVPSGTSVSGLTHNPGTGKALASYGDIRTRSLIEIDPAARQVAFYGKVPIEGPFPGINPITNVFYHGAGSRLTALHVGAKKAIYSGVSNRSPYNTSINPIDNSIFVEGSGDVLYPIRDNARTATGLRVHFDPLLNHATTLARPVLTGKAVNRPGGGHTGIAAVSHQLHTAQGGWRRAALGAGSGSDSAEFTLEWGTDSLRYGLNLVCIAALDSQSAAVTLVYPLYRVKELPVKPGVPALASPDDGAEDVRRGTVFSWTEAQGAASYEIRYAGDPDFTKYLTIRADRFGLTDTLGSFQYSTLVYWKVRGYNLGGFGEWSPTRRFTTIFAPPNSGIPLQPANHQKDIPVTAALVWRKSTADMYEVYYDTSATTASPLARRLATSDTTLQLSDLAAGVRYYWRVRGWNRSDTGSWSSPWDFTTIPGEPTVPVLKEPTSGAPDQPVWVRMKWGKADRAETYQIQIALDPAFATLRRQDSGFTDSSYAMNLDKGMVFHWRVRARNGGGLSAWSPAWSFTTTTQDPPAAPVLASPADGGTDRPYPVSFSWNRAALALTYHIQAARDSLFSSIADQDSLVSDSTLHLFNLAYSTAHHWRVRAKGKGGIGPWSGKWKFTTGIAPPIYPPMLAPARNAVDQPSPLSFRWGASRTATGFGIEVASDSAFDTVIRQAANLTDTATLLDGFKANTAYFWRIRGINSGGEGVWSPGWKFTTGATVSLPKAFSVFGITQAHGNGELTYALPKPCFVSIAYYDLHGRKVASLVNRMQAAGIHSVPLGKAFATGAALVQVFKAGDFESRGKVALLK